MPLHPISDMLKKAKKGKYAVGHFNFYNVESAAAIISAANKLKSPVILSATDGAIEYSGIENISSIGRNYAAGSKVPVALHLDHGKGYSSAVNCIKAGFNSVMIDGSYLDFEENVKVTKKVVSYAHKRNVCVEAELGRLKGVEEHISSDEHIYTEPEEAKEFVERTGVDSLAIAIGTSHGAYKFKGATILKYNILKFIARKVDVPLVLHGASGVPKDIVKIAESYGAKLSNARGVSNAALKKAVKFGICKVNTDTDLRIAWTAAVREFLKKNPAVFDPRHINKPAIALMAKVAEDRIRVLGSFGKGKY